MSAKTSSSSGIGVLGLLGCIFVTLKLCGVITWSWWWVTVPFWGGFALVFAVGGIFLLVCLLIDPMMDALKKIRSNLND